MGAGEFPRMSHLLTLHKDSGINLPLDHTINLYSEQPEGSKAAAACGLLCSIAIQHSPESALKYHGLCTIGGLLSIKDGSGAPKHVAVTTAHGVLDSFLTGEKDESSSQRVASATTSAVRHTARIFKTGSKSTSHSAAHSQKLPIRTLNPERVNTINWKPIKRIYAINWLGGGWESATAFQSPFQISDPEKLTLDADFALFELGPDYPNTYEVSSQARVQVTGWLPESEMTAGPVHVVFSSDDVVSASLMSDIPYFYVRGRQFHTRKILLEKPLRKLSTLYIEIPSPY